MVFEVDLTQQPDSVVAETQTIQKTSIFKRLRNKIRIWQANFEKKPFSHKITLLFLSLSVTALGSVALIYGFVLYTTPPHEPLDATYQLLEVQTQKQFSFSTDLPTPPSVKDKANPINGELYTKEQYNKLLKRKPLLVIIENHVDARPQAGLYNADLVYETLVESGITRFLAVFWGKGAKKVGPVRSLRTYYIDWSAEYDDPPIANIGQAGYEPLEEVIVPEADARSYIQKYNVKSFSWYGRNVYWRETDKVQQGIAWEHVAYSDTETLWEDAQSLGWVGPPSLTPLKFKKDTSKENRPLSQNIEITFLSLGAVTYKVEWKYNKDSNTYLRYLANAPHKDENNGKQIKAKNVIIQYCNYHQTGDKNGRILFDTIGSGTVKVFRDGKIIEGTWNKADRTSRTILLDDSGKNIKLNRGQIWFEIVPVSGNNVLSDIVIS